MENKKKKEVNKLDPQTVLTVNHSELKGVTQCSMEKHHWVKLNDNEIRCTKCPTILICNPETIKKLCQ